MNPTNSPQKPAFTLVELLVVIAIITLLISILLPSLSQAKEQAKATKCLANLKDVSAASMMYASADPSGFIVPMHNKFTETNNKRDLFIGIQNAVGGKSGSHEYAVTYGGSGDDYSDGYASTKRGFGPATRPLNRFIMKTLAVDKSTDSYTLEEAREDEKLDLDQFRCPSDNGWNSGEDGEDNIPDAYSDIGQGTSTYDIYGNSYTSIPFLIFDTSDNELRSISTTLRPFTQIVYPSLMTLYYEATDRSCIDWNRQFTGRQRTSTLDSYITGNHGGFNNVTSSFVDGHAEFAPRLTRTDSTSYSIEGRLNHTGRFYKQGSRLEELVIPDTDSSFYYTMRDVIFAGENWRHHAYPAPEFRTGLKISDDGGPRQ